LKRSYPPRSRQGVSRILEAVIAAALLLVTFSAAIMMNRSSEVKVLQESGDLDRLGYNVLSTIVESDAIDNSQSFLQVNTILQANLPSSIYYNLTIYNCTNANGVISFKPDPTYRNITNTATFFNAAEISSTSTIYTSPNGLIRKLVLELARAGQL